MPDAGLQHVLGNHQLGQLGRSFAVLPLEPVDHAKTDFALAHDHFVGAKLAQVLDFFVGMGPGDDADRWIELAALFGRLPCLKGVGDGNDDAAGARDIGQHQRLPRRGVADDDLDSGLAGRVYPALGIFDEHQGRARPLQFAANHRAHPPIADEDDVIALPGRLGLLLGEGPRSRGGNDLASLARHHRPEFRFNRPALRVPRFEARLEPLGQPEHQRVQDDRDDGAGQHEAAPLLGQHAEAHPERGEDEGEFADLRQSRRQRQRGTRRSAEQHQQQERHDGLAEQDDRQRRQYRQRLAHDDGRIEQHADRDEEQHPERVAQRQCLLGGAMAEFALRQDHAGKERAERQRHAEQIGGARRDAERNRQHGEAEQFAAAGMRRGVKDERNDPPPHDHHHPDEGEELEKRNADHAPKAELGVQHLLGQRDKGIGLCRSHGRGNAGAGRHVRGKGRDQDQRQHHGEIFHHQPADGDVAAVAIDQMPVLHRLEQHHGGGDSEREAKDDAAQQRPAHQRGEAHAQRGGYGQPDQRAGNGDPAHRQQVAQREVEADAEHQQDHADFGQLRGQRLVGDEARRMGADRNTGDQIADERRHAQPVGDGPEDEGQNQCRDNGRDQGRVVGHEILRRPVTWNRRDKPASSRCAKRPLCTSQRAL